MTQFRLIPGVKNNNFAAGNETFCKDRETVKNEVTSNPLYHLLIEEKTGSDREAGEKTRSPQRHSRLRFQI